MKKLIPVVAFTFLPGCEAFSALLDGLEILGVTPAEGFADASSEDFGLARIAVSGRNAKGVPLAPVANMLEVSSDAGEVEVEKGRQNPGHDAGSFVFLVDGSGSLVENDPGRNRVDAAKQLAAALSECAPDARLSLMEFGRGRPTSGFDVTEVIVDYTTEFDSSAADRLGEDGWTPLYDSTVEVTASLRDDLDEAFEAELAALGEKDEREPGLEGPTPEEIEDAGLGMGLVVMSDGEDTDSLATVQEAIDIAKEKGVHVNTVGLGPAADGSEETEQVPGAIAGLRQLSRETGGYYGAAREAKALPDITKNIADAFCAGYAELEVRVGEPPSSGETVSGEVGIRGLSRGVPFSFTAP